MVVVWRDVRRGGGVERCEKGWWVWRDVRNGGGMERCEKGWWCGEM